MWQPQKKVGLFFLLSAIPVSAEEVTAPIPIPKFGISFGSRYRPYLAQIFELEKHSVTPILR